VNQGTANDEGRTALTSTRLVFHMNTGGTGRFTEADHPAGSICAHVLLDSDPSNDIGIPMSPGPDAIQTA